MRLVSTLMTKNELSDDEISKCVEILLSEFRTNYEIYKYHYDESAYYEVDIDLFDIVFTEKDLNDNIMKLISCYEKIMLCISVDIDFIAANDDTHNEVCRYEKDINDVDYCGLFVTNRVVPHLVPYYSSDVCNAYVNLEYVSFGVYF